MFMNDSKDDGVIYFTLGSIIQMETTPGRMQKIFLEAFREIPQRVLWKYESESLGELPDNVKISKWFPQREILGKYLISLVHEIFIKADLQNNYILGIIHL